MTAGSTLCVLEQSLKAISTKRNQELLKELSVPGFRICVQARD